MEQKLTYQQSGVSIETADAAKQAMSSSLVSNDPRVLNRLGAFATLFEAKFPGIEDPILVLKAEEPGSKQLLAFQHERIEGICYDLINHLINDIAVMGAKPEAVLDIILCGRLEKDVVVRIVKAIAQACQEQGCTLVGGETSEQPRVLPPGTYMLNASVLGVVDRSKIIDGSRIRLGDRVIAVASNGLHTNGYTLVRRLLEEHPELATLPVGDESFLDATPRERLQWSTASRFVCFRFSTSSVNMEGYRMTIC